MKLSWRKPAWQSFDTVLQQLERIRAKIGYLKVSKNGAIVAKMRFCTLISEVTGNLWRLEQREGQGLLFRFQSLPWYFEINRQSFAFGKLTGFVQAVACVRCQ
jgi:hypothetical protein